MKINNKVFLVIGLFVSIYYAYIYQTEILLLLLPLAVLVKVKLIYYFTMIISKSSAFYAVSKTKFLFFLKTMTIYKTIVLGVKRFLIDNYFSKWLNNNVIDPIKEPIMNYIKFFFKLGWKTKLKRLAYFVLPIAVIGTIAQLTGMLESILLLAELKAIVIGFFKLLWIVLAKIGIFFSTWVFALLKNTWLVFILEIFALSWLMTKLEQIPFIGKYIIGTFNFISEWIGKFFSIFVKIYNKYIYGHISMKIKNKMEKVGEKLLNFLENTKHENEIFILKNFIKEFISGDNFKTYYSNIDFTKIYNKNEIYRLINKKTKDNIDIKYYFNIDVNSIHNDVLIIESVASCNETGNIESIINKHSFWVLNLSNKVVEIKSLSNKFISRDIKPKKIKLIHSLEHKFEDIVVSYVDEELLINDVYFKLEEKDDGTK